ncbi:type 1 glutamine amidotransferase domain-containing protein [Pseudomonas sp. SDO524_S393]
MRLLTSVTVAALLSLHTALSYAAIDAAPAGPKGRILLVASSANVLTFKEGTPHPTGYFVDELAVPAQAFIKAGYEVVVATPDGNTPALDGRSISKEFFNNDAAQLDQALRFVLTSPAMQKPQTLSRVVKAGLDGFDALYLPGGQAPMVDLMQDKDLGTALRYFHDHQKVTALLCHAPIALSAATRDPVAFRKAMVAGDLARATALAVAWPYAGYHMTVLSNAEEIPTEADIGGHLQFYMADALQAAGARVTAAPIWQPYVVSDRELITGQNPFSDHQLAEAVLAALDKQARQKTAVR